MRASTSLIVIAFALAGSLGGAAAQYYPPPPPPGYYPPPPPPPGYQPQAYPYPGYPPQPVLPQSYSRAPLPPPGYDAQAAVPPPPDAPYGHAPYSYRDANGAIYDPRNSGRDIPGEGSADDVPLGRPQLGPEDNVAPRPQPRMGGEPILRPPADVGQGSAPVPADVTGATRQPGLLPGAAPDRATVIAALPPEDQPEQGPRKELPAQFRRQLVDFPTREPAGTLVIDTPHTYLFLVLGNGTALRYGIGVGREGFTWTGTEHVSRMSEWPDWHPPKEMIERQPYLPRFMAGGDGNPLGARALYLGSTLYRIHGTNQPSTIGTFVSSGCIRLTNEDISDLYSRVNVGTRVVVLPGPPPATAASQMPISR